MVTHKCRTHAFDTWIGKIPWRRKWPPTPIFLPGESHGQRSLANCSPWDLKELDTRQWQPTPVLLPGKSHVRRSLVGCSPWVSKSRTRLSNFTLTLHFHALEKEMATRSSALAWRMHTLTVNKDVVLSLNI